MAEKETGYHNDDCMGMWCLRIDGVDYWFVCDKLNPLKALAYALATSIIGDDIDHLEDDPDIDWSIRLMRADEKVSAVSYGPNEMLGVLKTDEECRWEGTVKQAVDLCENNGDIMLSEAWVP